MSSAGDPKRSYSIEVAAPGDFDDIVRIDDDATELYAEAGLELVLGASHPFSRAERARWLRSAELGRLFLAMNAEGVRVGFAALDVLDDAAYLDQLSVRQSAMRRGAGGFLLEHALAWAERSGHAAIWLTTYGHLPWNVPFYRRHHFELVDESRCGSGVRHHLDEQRRWLPLPEQRVAMCRTLPR